MAKRRMKLQFRLPPSKSPRNRWRRAILHSAIEAGGHEVGFTLDDKLEIDIRLYMRKSQVAVHDVDNRLKDILDALQGRAGGSKSVRPKVRVIPNDTVIFKVSISKSLPPRQSRGLGHVTIRRLAP